MRRLRCLLTGHRPVPVRMVGLAPRPGGMLPMLDGYVTYAPDPDGEYTACQRCRRVPL